MGMNETPSANRVHIAFFADATRKIQRGECRDGAGAAVVSDVKGTTTDPSTNPWNCCRWVP
jgi:hypothetical protein